MNQAELMSQAFSDAAGFSGSNFTYFILCMIGIIAMAWGLIMVNGWLSLYRQLPEPGSFLISRLIWLSFVFVVLIILIGS